MNNSIKKTILVVDDTPENIDILSGILSDRYFVKAAINGDIALKIINNHHLDLILLDIMMPEMDGYEVLKQIKENTITSGIPVIFVTANEKHNLEYNQNIEGYLQKPIDPNTTLELIENILTNHHLKSVTN